MSVTALLTVSYVVVLVAALGIGYVVHRRPLLVQPVTVAVSTAVALTGLVAAIARVMAM
ncbi:hypothetical protein [Streptomyces sp. TLI_146]|uniref:hypothetical protein n=1 Tax=Streptomyces sp. TLI_146 TaxID=1938858 RepID=UPI000CB72E32|nr:hypothetical protein [Streptomyces sp. TLI_146]PKV82594.1 hypothetical protein BX283_0027 [Streptomyces sp. TLI_146]